MITPFFRSSLLNTFQLCPLRSFLEYSIGLRGESNLSALVGSITHGVLENLLLEKLALQNNIDEVNHESFGCWKLDVRGLSDHLDIVYDYYNKESPNLLTEDSYKECEKLVNKALTFQNGSFHPWNNNAYAAEFPFELTLEDEWAKYEYDSPDGKIYGQLSLKGTIDTVYIENENTFHCIDYKTGKAANDWASGKTKVLQVIDPEKETSLYNDQQLMLYYYVLAHKFPDKDIIMTLYFIRIDKAFTIVFDRKKDLPRIHAWLKERFQYICEVEKPSWIDGTKDGWKCRFCPFSKNKQPGSNLSVCRFYQKEFAQRTHDEILNAYADFSTISSYGAGGSSKERE